jgi:hypothetical protein
VLNLTCSFRPRVDTRRTRGRRHAITAIDVPFVVNVSILPCVNKRQKIDGACSVAQHRRNVDA